MINRIVKPLILGAALSFGMAAPALAQQPPRPGAEVAQTVTVDVQVVHATNAHSRVDSSLRSVEKHLRFLNYTGFSRLDSQATRLSPGEKAVVPVVGGREMHVTLVSVDSSAAKLRVQLFTGSSKKLDTTVSIHRNRSFIVGGPKHDDGVLVFPLTASY
ncbi:MAG: hypothetical protein EP330_18615 [Deltaproteobacteria bacterium]|nr:MAG: hypothetical protein EP330_18615 [Deltaproteobacteria bacterium]